jgi:hypothetical protein
VPTHIPAASDGLWDAPVSEIGVDHLETAYGEMAADEARESEALAWAEALVGDVAAEPQ